MVERPGIVLCDILVDDFFMGVTVDSFLEFVNDGVYYSLIEEGFFLTVYGPPWMRAF